MTKSQKFVQEVYPKAKAIRLTSHWYIIVIDFGEMLRTGCSEEEAWLLSENWINKQMMEGLGA